MGNITAWQSRNLNHFLTANLRRCAASRAWASEPGTQRRAEGSAHCCCRGWLVLRAGDRKLDEEAGFYDGWLAVFAAGPRLPEPF